MQSNPTEFKMFSPHSNITQSAPLFLRPQSHELQDAISHLSISDKPKIKKFHNPKLDAEMAKKSNFETDKVAEELIRYVSLPISISMSE